MPGTKYKGEPDLTEPAKWKKALLMIKAAEAKLEADEDKQPVNENRRTRLVKKVENLEKLKKSNKTNFSR